MEEGEEEVSILDTITTILIGLWLISMLYIASVATRHRKIEPEHLKKEQIIKVIQTMPDEMTYEYDVKEDRMNIIGYFEWEEKRK